MTANEVDLIKDGGVRSHVMIYELKDQKANYPQIVSTMKDDGTPIGWGALSGLVGDPKEAGKVYAYPTPSTIRLRRFTRSTPSRRRRRSPSALVVKRGGQAAQKLDLEGITTDGDGGFWLANEGDQAKLVPHAIFNVNDKGEIKKEIALPDDLLPNQIRYRAGGHHPCWRGR